MSRIRTTMSARLMCAALLAATVAGTAPATAVDSEERASVTATSGDAQMLSEPAQGRAALRALGDDLSAAAALNNTTPKELSRLLREDDTMWLDRAGRLYAVDPAPAPLPEATAPVEPPVGNNVASIDDVGQMHSKPGAPTRSIWTSTATPCPPHPRGSSTGTPRQARWVAGTSPEMDPWSAPSTRS